LDFFLWRLIWVRRIWRRMPSTAPAILLSGASPASSQASGASGERQVDFAGGQRANRPFSADRRFDDADVETWIFLGVLGAE
jgi:hypothetical protein